jgi:hypothetical protein
VLGGNLKAELAQLEGADEATVQKIRADWQKRHEEVVASGGLHIVGTERHESRRIDNQLRGRSGRQGDPGASKFFLSLEDDLMRIFGNNKVLDWVQKKGMADDEALTHRWLNKALETAQGKVEARNFEIRKNLLRFDDVMNSQRKEIYKERIELMGTEDVSDTIAGMWRDVNATRAVLDGEIVVFGDDGRPSFEGLQRHDTQVVFQAFDVLDIDGNDVTGLIDFDEARADARAVDIAASILADTRSVGWRIVRWVAGYAAHADPPLTEQEADLVPVVMAALMLRRVASRIAEAQSDAGLDEDALAIVDEALTV